MANQKNITARANETTIGRWYRRNNNSKVRKNLKKLYSFEFIKSKLYKGKRKTAI